MKLLTMIAAMLISVNALQAQSGIPEGFSKGSIVLPDGSHLTGFVKDNIRRDASVSFINAADKKKKDYDGNDLNAVQIENSNYICIKGDFFKVLSEGELSFLQKSSNAAGKTVYNGLENAVIAGTDGKPGDYFIYNSGNSELQKISRKNLVEITASTFAGCAAAIEKAKTLNGDLAAVKDAVDIYNNRHK